MFKTNAEGQLILTTELKALLRNVHKKGNKDITYQTDLKTYGTVEKWDYPMADGFKLVGDCEDYCLYKHRLLIGSGVPAGPVLMTICLDPERSGHCVLSVVTDKGDFIMCNQHLGLSNPNAMDGEGYTFLYRQQLGKGLDDKFDILNSY